MESLKHNLTSQVLFKKVNIGEKKIIFIAYNNWGICCHKTCKHINKNPQNFNIQADHVFTIISRLRPITLKRKR